MKAKRMAAMMIMAAALAMPAAAADTRQNKAHGANEIKKDIANHRAMADAHLNAAKCLESGKSEKECLAQLAKDCKGLAIGKYCGMKHIH
jgi:opacity protein-like surface antigen